MAYCANAYNEKNKNAFQETWKYWFLEWWMIPGALCYLTGSFMGYMALSNQSYSIEETYTGIGISTFAFLTGHVSDCLLCLWRWRERIKIENISLDQQAHGYWVCAPSAFEVITDILTAVALLSPGFGVYRMFLASAHYVADMIAQAWYLKNGLIYWLKEKKRLTTTVPGAVQKNWWARYAIQESWMIPCGFLSLIASTVSTFCFWSSWMCGIDKISILRVCYMIYILSSLTEPLWYSVCRYMATTSTPRIKK